jgi:sirohydrochlorin ferrochelatase
MPAPRVATLHRRCYTGVMQRKSGVIVVTHGSRLAAANEIMVQLVDALRARLGATEIEPCFMELAHPTIPEAVERLVGRGCNHIFGYAFFLVPGRHLQKDIPAILETAVKKHPGVTWEVTEPMMDDPSLLDLVAARIRRAMEQQ